jgi:hypothetical protein
MPHEVEGELKDNIAVNVHSLVSPAQHTLPLVIYAEQMCAAFSSAFRSQIGNIFL